MTTPDATLAGGMQIGPARFVWGARTYIMGIVNTSPESFSGDGLASVEAALLVAVQMATGGADILDIGGQSTRPGAKKTEAGFDEITPDEEIRRVVPLIERLRAELPLMPLSIDTYKPGVARAALAAGAHLLNDIYGFCRDPELARIAAAADAPAIVMHNQRLKREPSHSRQVIDVADAISRGLRESMAIADAAGLPASKLIADPGFGFGWTADQNIEMLRRLGELRALGLPLLVGTSRKSTIGSILGDVPVDQREFGTAATVALAIAGGADIVRVHDVTAMKQVALVADAIVRGEG